jgi:hypothetical protein
MAKNVDLGSSNFGCTKNSFFIFLVQKLVFCGASTKNMLQKWNKQILENIIPYIMHNSPVVCMEQVLEPPLKRQNSADSA